MQNNESVNLSQALGLYIGSLKEEHKQEIHQELSRFIRWCGRDRSFSDLSPPEIGDYAELLGASGTTPGAGRRLEAIRGFLSFAQKQSLLTQNLAQHMKARGRGRSRKQEAQIGRPSSEVRLTPEGYAQLQSRLEMLKEERVRVAGEIRRAAADKDVRENAPLEAAREQQGHLEARIREIEATLKVAVVIEESEETSEKEQVRLGSRVHIKDMASGREMTYMLVSPSEASPLDGRLSSASPVGGALLDRYPGQEIEVAAPSGTQRYLILGVSS